MKYSILVPVYNVEKYLEQCLDSILVQTYKDFEVLLTDDGSTDKSGEICDRYFEKYPHIFRVFHKKNEGLLLTRRHALKHAKGEYIIFVDSDDYVAENLLETVDKTIQEHACDMVLYNFYRFVDGEEGFFTPNIQFSDGEIFEGDKKTILYEQFILKHTFVNMWIKAVKREVVDIDYDYRTMKTSKAEDVMQTFPLFNNSKKIIYIDQKLYYYRKNSGSMTLNVKLADFEDYIKCAKRTKEYIGIWNFDKTIDAKDTANKVSFFYNYLRKAELVNDKALYKNAVEYLLATPFFIDLCKKLDLTYINKRLRFRLSLFKNYVIKENRVMLKILITASNILTKGRK